jgi:glucokinase
MNILAHTNHLMRDAATLKNLILGVEIGGTKLQLAVGNMQGEILHCHFTRVNPDTGGEGIRAWLLEEVPTFLREVEHKENQRIEVIGCGFGGPIDTHAGRVLNSVQIKGWKNFPLQQWFEEHFNRPTIAVNDSNAATWGEYCLGFGEGCRHFFYTNLGSGVGGGFVLDGKLFDGQGFGAGEFGHTYVPDWTSKKRGCGIEIERVCSGWAIESRLNLPNLIPPSSRLFKIQTKRRGKLTARDLGEAADKGDPFALQEIDRIAKSMGYGLANVLALTGVERIAIGGGVSNIGATLINSIRRYTQRFEFVTNQGRYHISQCQLGDQIVLVGAILLAGKTLNRPK